MELTNEIKAKVFGLYLGCDVWDEEEREYGVLTGVESNGNYSCDFNHCIEGFLPNDTIKLLLTKLENITDADAIACYDANSERSAYRTDKQKIDSVKMGISLDFMDYKRVDLLRSKGYAVDYCGIDLFQSGIAIERTPTVQPRDKEQELHGDGTGHALPPIESHHIDEEQTKQP